MTEQVDYVLERTSANDDEAIVIKIHVEDGQTVTAGQHVLDIETSKATEEIEAPAEGVLRHDLKPDQRLAFGSTLFSVLPPEGAKDHPEEKRPETPEVESKTTASAPKQESGLATRQEAGQESAPASAAAAAAASPASGQRLSRRARALAAREGLDLAALGEGWVTVHDVERLLRPKAAPARLEAAAQPSGTGSAETIALPPHKRSEIAALEGGAAAGALSVIGTRLGRIGRQSDRRSSPFFSDKITDLVAFEAARLMRKYPRLNAAYRGEGQVALYEEVNAGIAFDDGNRLTVYAVSGADRLSLPAIQTRIQQGLEDYVERRLGANETGSATFTITDLSALGIDFVHPLLPKGQSAIIAIARSQSGGYALFLGFDHRVTEGREAALYLSDLAARLRSFASDPSEEASCAICGKTAAEEIAAGGRGLMVTIDAKGAESLSCQNCLSGW